MEKFDLEKVYDDEISPLMNQIIGICKRIKMPMLASFCYKLDEGEEHFYCTTSLPRDEWYPEELNEAFTVIRNGASTRPKAMALTITKAPIPGGMK